MIYGSHERKWELSLLLLSSGLVTISKCPPYGFFILFRINLSLGSWHYYRHADTYKIKWARRCKDCRLRLSSTFCTLPEPPNKIANSYVYISDYAGRLNASSKHLSCLPLSMIPSQYGMLCIMMQCSSH